MRKTIWGQTIVKNEERFIYFSLASVVDYLDKILVWDTGSTDNTVNIIKFIQKKYPKKIIFKEIGEVSAEELTKSRQKMLNFTQSDWLFILDGDEVWWRNSLKKTLNLIEQKGDNIYAFVHPVINLIGDVYHFQEEAAGKYEILGRKGHLNIRVINRRVPGLHIKNTYPLEGFYDRNEGLIQEITDKLFFLDAHFLHFTHLNRSSKDKSRKIKYELGIPFPKNFKYPEVLHLDLPEIVPSPWIGRSVKYIIRATIETPLKRLKRKVI